MSARALAVALGLAAAALVAACAGAASLASGPASSPPPPPPPLASPAEAPAAAVGRALARSVHVALGVPADQDPSDDHLLDKGVFVVSYNPKLNAPNWVAWNLGRKHLGRAPRSRGFHSETALPSSFFVVRDADYAGSGYDRGHLCPSADRSASPELNEATFVLSNVHPQIHELNAGPWEKLEEHERDLARRGKELYIVAGGLFDREPPRIGKHPDPARRAAIPRASYKVMVVLDEGQGLESVTERTEALAVVMPNEREAKDHAWTDYLVTVRDVEYASGYDFHGRVPRAVQDVVERRRYPAARVDDAAAR